MEHITGRAHTAAGEGAADSRMHLRSGGQDDEADNSAWERLNSARERAGTRIGDVARAIDERTGAIRLVRERPWLALGLAFGTGVVIAAGTALGDRNWALVQLRKHLRTAVMAGLAAALADEVKDLLEGEDGIGPLLHSFMGEDPDSDTELR